MLVPEVPPRYQLAEFERAKAGNVRTPRYQLAEFEPQQPKREYRAASQAVASASVASAAAASASQVAASASLVSASAASAASAAAKAAANAAAFASTSGIQRREAQCTALIDHMHTQGAFDSLGLQPSGCAAKRDADRLRIAQFAISGELTISAVVPGGTTHVLKQGVPPDATVAEVKILLERVTNIPNNEQELMYCGQKLKDSQTLIESGVTPFNSTFVINWIKPELFLSGDGSGALRIWEPVRRSSSILDEGDQHTEAISAVVVDWSMMQALTASMDTTLRLWNLKTCRCVMVLEGHSAGVSGAAVFWPGKQALSASHDGTLRLWCIERGSSMNVIEVHGGAVNAVDFEPENLQALSGSEDGTVRLWEISLGRCLQNFKGHYRSVTAVSGDWRRMRALSASIAWDLKLWNLATGECLCTLDGHRDAVWSLDVDWASMKAVSASQDSILKLWDLANMRCLKSLTGHKAAVCAVAVDWQKLRAVSSSQDSTLKIWDLRNDFMSGCETTLACAGTGGAVLALAFGGKGDLSTEARMVRDARPVEWRPDILRST